MGSLILGVILGIVGIAISFVKFDQSFSQIKKLLVPIFLVAAIAVGGMGGFGYNSAGYSTHIQTIFGTESAKMTTGWYFKGWGYTTIYPHFITVSHTNDPTSDGTSVNEPYSVRLADNWNGTVTQTTRFEIPKTKDEFIDLHQTYRGPSALVNRTLRPAVLASLDSVANLFTMEEYYAGGKRDQFKTEYRDAISLGRAQVRQILTNRIGGNVVDGNAAANDLDFAQDESVQENLSSRITIMEKVIDDSGNVIREPHDFMQYGIIVSQATLENLDPDDRFEDQIQARKDAASRRIVAQEERREQEEQRLLAIQRGQTEIAKRQAEAQVEQIERTTNAETQKKLALIEASRIKEEATIAKQTSQINLEKARIDAETKQTLADAEAYERRVILEADNALSQKLKTYERVNEVWAEAASKINVPATVFSMGEGGSGTTGNLSSLEQFMAIMTMNAAKGLDVDTSISKK